MRPLIRLALVCTLVVIVWPVAALHAQQAKLPWTFGANENQPVLLRFQLIKAVETKTTDPAIREIDSTLQDLFHFPGYKLLMQTAIMVDYSPGPKAVTMQRLSAEGVTYQLAVTPRTITPEAVQLEVKLWVVEPGMSGGGQLFGTTASVSFKHAAILGSTQLTGATGGTLILTVKPELQPVKSARPPGAEDPLGVNQVDEPVQYVSGPMPRYPDSLRARGVSGVVTMRFVVGVDGKVEESSLNLVSSTNAAFVQPALDAIRGSTFRPAMVQGVKVRQIVEQVVRFSPPATAVPIVRDSGAVETFTVDQVDDPVAFVGGPVPKFPPSLRAAGVTGRVTLRFVVGVDGKVEPTSVKVSSSTNTAFEQPAIDAIKASTFRPALLKGTKVRQVVEQVVRFTTN